MTSLAKVEPDKRIRTVSVTDEQLIVSLMNDDMISVPLSWFPRLLNGSPEQRAYWELAGAGYGIHWPDLDEDLNIDALLRGARAPRGSENWQTSFS